MATRKHEGEARVCTICGEKAVHTHTNDFGNMEHIYKKCDACDHQGSIVTATKNADNPLK